MSVKIKYFISVSGLFVTLLGIVVIAGWVLNIHIIKNVLPGRVAMKFNTALGFILAGFAFCVRQIHFFKKWRNISYCLAAVLIIFGTLSLIQENFPPGFGIDELFIKDNEAIIRHEHNPGRMSPLTAFCFAMTGSGLLFQVFRKRTYQIFAQYLFHIVSVISFSSFIGYLYSVPKLYYWHFANSMAVHTALGFLLLSVAAALTRPTIGLPGIFTSSFIGNKMAQMLFLGITVTTICGGYACILLCRMYPEETEFIITLITIILIVASLIFISRTAKQINSLAQKEKMSETNFRLAIESAPYAIFLSDGKGSIKMTNYQAERLYGYTSEEIKTLDSNALLPKEKHEEVNRIREKFISTPETMYLDGDQNLYALKKNGEKFPIEAALTHVKTEKGPLILSYVIDITARKQQEEIIKSQLEDLQIKNQELEQFNYIASHDLQEPLRTVSNYIQLIEEDYESCLNEEMKSHLAAMYAATQRMSRLVRSLLDFGRLGKDKKLVMTDCNKVVENVISDLNNLINKNEAVINVPPDLPILYAYESELYQLFQNLINNAVKFKKENTPPYISINCLKTDGYYQFSVTDNGIGISPEYSSQIFHLFQRINTKTKYEGYGIGLANCKKIVEMHGGKIWIKSEPEEGTTFYFSIINFKI